MLAMSLSPIFLVVMTKAAQLNQMFPVPESDEGPRSQFPVILFEKGTLSVRWLLL